MSMDEMKNKLLEEIKQEFGDKITAAYISYDMPVVEIDPAIHADLPKWLKEHAEWAFNHFTDITAVDYADREARFEVVVHLRSHKTNLRLRIKTPVTMPEAPKDEEGNVIPSDAEQMPELPTLVNTFLGAKWTEREIFDMMGIRFTDHPRMTRLLNPDDFDGHPLRKDFPVKGKHRGSFPKGTIVSNKRRDVTNYRQTKPLPADQILPNTPWEQQRAPMRGEEKGNA